MVRLIFIDDDVCPVCEHRITDSDRCGVVDGDTVVGYVHTVCADVIADLLQRLGDDDE